MKTLPSSKVNFKVFLEDDQTCILEVKRGDKFFIYEILESGEEKLLTTSLGPYLSQVEPEYRYLDYLSMGSLNKIDLLTSTFSYKETIDDFWVLIHKISNRYSFEDFNVEEANLIEDYKAILGQLHVFTGDSEYSERLNKLTKFFDEYFYNRTSELSSTEKDLIISQIKQEISFLGSLGSN
jgi:hypothetical protein